MKKRTIIIVCSAVLAIALLSIGITYAYLGTNEEKKNKVMVGRDTVSITESFPEVSEQSMENKHTKEVQIKNTGSVPCYVRVYAEFSDSRIAEKAKVDGCNLKDTAWSEFKTALSDENNSSKWVYVKTGNLAGYFYYKDRVMSGDSTSELIKKVKVDYRDPNDTNDSNIDKIQPYEMIVYTETVQSTDIDGTEYGVKELKVNNIAYAANKQWELAWKRFLKVP